jgi:hypothetical protein
MADAVRAFFRYNKHGAVPTGWRGTQPGFGVVEILCQHGWRMGAQE